jgi:hypothetical protein
MHANTANPIGIARNKNVVPLLVVMLPLASLRERRSAREKKTDLYYARCIPAARHSLGLKIRSRANKSKTDATYQSATIMTTAENVRDSRCPRR